MKTLAVNKKASNTDRRVALHRHRQTDGRTRKLYTLLVGLSAGGVDHEERRRKLHATPHTLGSGHLAAAVSCCTGLSQAPPGQWAATGMCTIFLTLYRPAAKERA